MNENARKSLLQRLSKQLRAQDWLIAAFALVIALAASRVWLIPAHFSTDPNEGWNAFQAVHATGGGALYPPPDALTGNNYPPLSFYVVGWIGRVIGDPIVAGRWVALVSMLAVAAAIYRGIRCFSGAVRWPAWVGVLIFLGFNATLFRGYLAMDDPQWLGHALMSWGLVLLLTARSDEVPKPSHVITSSLLMFLGGMVKHNLVAFPLAAILWLVWRDRRLAGAWLAAAIVWAIAALAICYAAYGPDFVSALVGQPRHYSLVRMLVRSLPIVAALLPMIIVAVWLSRKRVGDPRIVLLLLTAAVAVPLGVIQRAGQGVDYNAHFDSLIILCIVAGAALSLPVTRPSRRRIMTLLCAPFVILVPLGAIREYQEVATRARTEAAWRDMQSHIAGTPGRVACATAALCYWAGKDFEVDFFLYGQRAAADPAVRQAMPARLSGLTAIQLEPPRTRVRPGEIDNPLVPFVEENYVAVYQDPAGRRLMSAAAN